MTDQVANFIEVVVSGTYDDAATEITLGSGEGALLPDPSGDNYNVVWYNYTAYPGVFKDPKVEIVRVTAKTDDVITVTRNQEGTGASTKSDTGTYKMMLSPTAKTITDLQAEIDADITTHAGNSDAHHNETHTIVSHDTTVTGAELNADHSKLGGIDAGAKDDQTGAEIKTLYEAEVNAYTDTKNTKLSGIDEGAKDDQTGAEIKALYEAEVDTNAYDDAAVSKLAGIDAGAKDDQTGAEIKALYEGEADTNAYDDAAVSKLGGIEGSADVTDAVNVGSSIHGVAGKSTPIDADEIGLIDTGAANVLKKLTWTNVKATLKTYFDTVYTTAAALTTHAADTSTHGVAEVADAADLTTHEADTSTHGVSEVADAADYETGADITDAVNVGSSIHGVDPKATPVNADTIPITDSAAANVMKKVSWTNVKATLKTYFDTLYNNYSHPNHSGDVTSVGDGAQTIVADAVTYDKIQNVVNDERVLGRVSGANGIVEELTKAQLLALINVTEGADVTGSNPPQNHASRHTDGTDDIQDATSAQKGLATATQITKLDSVDANADETAPLIDAPYNNTMYLDTGVYYIRDNKTLAILQSNANRYTALNAAIQALSDGTIYVKNIDIDPTSVTVKENITVIVDYLGIMNFIGAFGHTGGQPYGYTNDHPAIRLHCDASCNKPIIEWRDRLNQKIAWIVAHEQLYEDAQYKDHKHISIETCKADMTTVITRWDMDYGADKVNSRFSDCDVILGDDVRLFLSDAANKEAMLYYSDSAGKVILTAEDKLAFRHNGGADQTFDFYHNTTSDRTYDTNIKIFGAGTGNEFIQLGCDGSYARFYAGAQDIYINSNKGSAAITRLFTGTAHATPTYGHTLRVYGATDKYFNLEATATGNTLKSNGLDLSLDASVGQVIKCLKNFNVDVINEYVTDAGVTIETVLIKDGEVDGRDVSVDGTKLDGIEAAADVTLLRFNKPNKITESNGTTLKNLSIDSAVKAYTPENGMRYFTDLFGDGTETRMHIGSYKSSSKGIWAVYVNGVLDTADLDDYAASGGSTSRTITLTESILAGHNTIEFRITGKNASSSDYGLNIYGIAIQ